MTALDASLWRDLVGKRYLADGRGPLAYDCLGLCMEITRRRGFAVPAYQSTRDELQRQYAEGHGALGICRRIVLPETGAVVLIRTDHTSLRHMGIMLDTARMIHASEGPGSVVVEHLGRSIWARRLIGFYRPEHVPEPMC